MSGSDGMRTYILGRERKGGLEVMGTLYTWYFESILLVLSGCNESIVRYVCFVIG
jgi:hypothetical protein